MFKVSIICAIFLAQGIYGQRKWNDFRVKFAFTEKGGYFAMPKSLQDPLLKDYVQVPNPGPYKDGLNLRTYCFPNDPRVCVLFDKNGITAGIQISFLKDELNKGISGPFLYDPSKLNMFQSSNLFGKPAYTVRVFFANPAHLKDHGRKNTDQTADSIWAYLDEGWVEMAMQEPPQPNNGAMKHFVKQACFPGMGQHYFYKLDEKTQCDKLQTFFPLYENGHLIAFGLGTFGKTQSNKREWFEIPPTEAPIIPRRPACLDDWGTKYGFSTLHVYFVDQPWKIGCPH
uniref:Venom protein family 33 protein 1 n=1 Tax=Lethocerus distinctifemur TaxID=280095 RepID=A0A2K8JLE3_9HEMI|nr:venom protein family 33 protein 1 [Lethocerus distinctifemur]